MSVTTRRPARAKPFRLLSNPLNAKLGVSISSFALPVYETCPGMTAVCKLVCYAGVGHFATSAHKARHKENHVRSLGRTFAKDVAHEIKKAEVRVVRVHVAGDFYSAAYARKWAEVAAACPDTKFYAYTRSWRRKSMLPALVALSELRNFYLWWSEDAKSGESPKVKGVRVAFLVVRPGDDALVDRKRHALVFRDRRHRSAARGVVKWVGQTLVCPTEQWYRWHPGMKAAEPPDKITCSACKICFTGRLVRSPENRRTAKANQWTGRS